MRLAWLFVVFAIACNQVFDLRNTKGPTESDTDGDGIKDVIDNCPFAPNFNQLDSDFDSLGDACDPCPFGPQSGADDDHDGVDDACDACLTGANADEDGDGIADGCDVCPGISDDQADGDGDGVGDACDTSAAHHHRVFFDGFDPARPGWDTGFSSWHVTSGSFVPDDPATGNPIIGPWNRGAAIIGIEIHVDVIATIPPPASQFDLVGVNLINLKAGQAIDGCTLVGTDQGKWQVRTAMLHTVAAGTIKFHMFLTPSSIAGMVQIACTIDGTTTIGGTIFSGDLTLVPSLLTTVSAQFLSIDVIQ